MDSILSRQEKRELCDLLEIPHHCYGNIPMMKAQYKKMCLLYHPDKGGDGAKMVKLNSLWTSFQDEVTKLRAEVNFFSYQENEPIYGTPQFKTWWYQQHGSYFSESQSTSKPSRGGPSRRFSRATSPDSTTSTSTTGSGIFTESSQHSDVGPAGSQTSSAKTTSSSGRSRAPSGGGTGVFGSAAYSREFRSETQDSDLYCDETLGSSPESTGEDDGPSTSASQPTTSTPQKPRKAPPGAARKRAFDDGDSSAGSSRTFDSTPPKTKKNENMHHPADFPSCLSDYLSHAVYSNKTVSSFAVFSTLEKITLLYEKCDKFKVDFKSRHKYRSPDGSLAGILFLITLTKHRVSAVKNYCSMFCTISFLIVKGVNKSPEFYRALCNEPFQLLEENRNGVWSYEFDSKNEKAESVSWTAIAEFAETYELEDPLIIMAHYLDFANPFPCAKCHGKGLKAHKDHEKQHNNAKLFKNAKAQKNICQQAADVVLAKKRLKILESSREELLAEKFKKQLSKLKELSAIPLLEHMAGVAWYCCLFNDFEEKLVKVLQLLTENCPKHRNCLFIGPINSGKTSFAAAILDLIEGKSLNVNCPADKLNFELGCAIDHFAVVFEDVKGQTSLNKTLQPGQGIHNLDNLREHLDGAVSVNLERKHVNKRTQIFPPCIVTANEYVFPQTLLARFAYTLKFEPRKVLRKALEANKDLGKHRILQQGLTLLLALIWLCPSHKFHSSIREDISTWKSILNSEIGNEKFCIMIENIEKGLDPLKDFIEEEDANTDDSGRFTQSQ
nr:large T antigen [Bovine polyomavirus 2]